MKNFNAPRRTQDRHQAGTAIGGKKTGGQWKQMTREELHFHNECYSPRDDDYILDKELGEGYDLFDGGNLSVTFNENGEAQFDYDCIVDIQKIDSSDNGLDQLLRVRQSEILQDLSNRFGGTWEYKESKYRFATGWPVNGESGIHITRTEKQSDLGIADMDTYADLKKYIEDRCLEDVYDTPRGQGAQDFLAILSRHSINNNATTLASGETREQWTTIDGQHGGKDIDVKCTVTRSDDGKKTTATLEYPLKAIETIKPRAKQTKTQALEEYIAINDLAARVSDTSNITIVKNNGTHIMRVTDVDITAYLNQHDPLKTASDTFLDNANSIDNQGIGTIDGEMRLAADELQQLFDTRAYPDLPDTAHVPRRIHETVEEISEKLNDHTNHDLRRLALKLGVEQIGEALTDPHHTFTYYNTEAHGDPVADGYKLLNHLGLRTIGALQLVEKNGTIEFADNENIAAPVHPLQATLNF